MTASRPQPWTLDRLVPRLFSAGWPEQPLTAQVSFHAEPVTGTWTTSVISQQSRFVPVEETAGDPGQAASDDRSYLLTLAPGGRYRLELVSGDDPCRTVEDEDEDEDDEQDEDDDGTDPWASAVADPGGPSGPASPAGDAPWRGYCGDGTSHWIVYGDRAERTSKPVLPASVWAMLDPAWLVSGWDLHREGNAEAAGRTVVRIIATPRPLTSGGLGRGSRLDRIVILADPDLGLLLGHEIVRTGRSDETTLITSLVPGPADASSAPFRPPPGIPVSDSSDHDGDADPGPQLDGPGWRLVKSAAGALGEGLGLAVQNSRRAQTPPGAPPMPDPGPPDPVPADLPDSLVNLLHRTGQPAPRFSATAAVWYDSEGLAVAGQAMRTGSVPWAGQGPDELWAALTGRPLPDRYQQERVTLSLPGRYRVDQLSAAGGRGLRTEASDGERHWAIYRDRVDVQPADRHHLDDRWLRLADPSWLLGEGWQLSAAQPQQVGGREGWLLWAHYTGTLASVDWLQAGRGLRPQMCVVADAELGVLLRMTSCADGKPVTCTELTDLTVPPPGADRDLFAPDMPEGVPIHHSHSLRGEPIGPISLRDVWGVVSRAWRERSPGGPA